MAAFAVEVVNAPFEIWELDRPCFDAVVAFAATRHVLPEDGDTFFADVQERRIEGKVRKTYLAMLDVARVR